MLVTTNNISLFTKNYLVPNAKAHILIVHGLNEHAERYIHLANELNTLRANVYTFDLRGHGRSGGEQVFVTDINIYTNSI
jgi:alpha-beta hydrolase superfamily lysophospholipase